MSESKAVAGYYRVSVARDNMHSSELYEDEISRYCSYKRIELAHIFSDIDYSAFRGARPRPSLEALIADRHNYSAVIIPKLSRFGRSMKELIKLFDIFDTDSIPLIFLDMNLDTSTSQGRLLRHILAAFAEYESDVKGDYARANIRRAAEAGLPHGPLPPYGYVRAGEGEERTLVVDEARAAIVREVFERYAGGEGFSSIGRDLDSRGERGIKGGRWAREHIRLLIDQPAYVGFRRLNGELFRARWKPIISRELWDAVRERRDANRQAWRAPRPKALLAGLIHCGVCAKRLVCMPADRGARIYKCKTGIDLPPRCLGGQVLMTRADAMVSDAIHQMFDLVTSAREKETARRLQARWGEGSTEARRDLLGELVEKVILLPRPPGNRHGKGQKIGRSLRIEWAREWSIAAFGHADAYSVLTPPDPNVRSSAGKTWAEWTRELRAIRQRGRSGR